MKNVQDTITTILLTDKTHSFILHELELFCFYINRNDAVFATLFQPTAIECRALQSDVNIGNQSVGRMSTRTALPRHMHDVAFKMNVSVSETMRAAVIYVQYA